MPIEAIGWDSDKPAMEIHVIAGTKSPDLRVDRLYFQTRDANNDIESVYAKKYMDDHPNEVTLTFTIADASVDPGLSTRDFSSHGITLDGTTGEVTVTTFTTLPIVYPRNFLLEVQAVIADQKPFRELIRVHVHRWVDETWLTPGTLTLRPRRDGAFPKQTKSRFALRARFDDKSVGDITDWPNVKWSSVRGTAATNHVNAEGRLIVENAGDAAAPPVTIHARLQGHVLPDATATLRIVEPWKPEAPVMTRLISGAGFPPTPPAQDPVPFASSLDAVPNVLFLPDGFPDGSEDTFFKYVTNLVHSLKTDSPLTKPYDVLLHSINFWAAFIPSPQLGITWGGQVFPFEPSGLQFMSVDKPARPQHLTSGTIWETEHLIYEVGLAMPDDRLSNTARTNQMIMDEWTSFYGPAFKAHLPTDPELLKSRIDFWRRTGARTIVDDLDTPLGLTSSFTRVDSHIDDLRMNPDRMDRDRLNDLLSALRHDDANSALRLDTVWTDARKRNYDLICIVTNVFGRALNAFGYFTQTQGFLFFTMGTTTGVNSVTLTPFPLREIALGIETRVFAHELSHSFDLGDEYRGTNDRPLFPVWVEYYHRVDTNLQSPSTLTSGGGTVVTGDEIKWRWPRIQWAAEIAGPITATGGTDFEFPIRWRHAFAIPVGKIVHLRFRNVDYAYRDKTNDHVHFNDKRSYLVKLPFVSIPLKLVDAIETGTPLVKKLRLKVDSSAPFPYPMASTITADKITTTFLPGSIVYQPTPAPPGAFNATSYPYAELVAKNVKDHITSMGRPATHASPHESPFETWFGTMTTLPDDIPSKTFLFIVALSEGGAGNDLGLFHPTRECMMANQNEASRYCHVCKYVLVDAIDPGKHYFLDPEYDEIYPQK